jgi:RNA polymerase sigma factor (sigma-70 family)
MPGAEIVPRAGDAPSRSLRRRSDERLLRIARDGDERAFELLFERHGPAILRYCRSLLRAPQEAEDVRQEVFVLAISALRRGAEPRSFRPWLYRIAHNACVSHLRIRRPVLVGDDGMLAGSGPAVEPGDVHREELRQLLNDIRLLPEVQRGALLLREMDGFSYEQVGQVLGVPQSTVRASIFRARRTLQGLAEARDADCQAIQSELCELADRRGRRNRRITAHLRVCPSCRSFRDALRRRPSILGVTPSGMSAFGPVGPILALKAKLFGGVSAGGAGAAAAAGAGGSAGVAKVAALASTCAVLATGSLEAERALDTARQDRGFSPPDAGGTPHRDGPGRTPHAVATSAAAADIARPTAATTAPGARADAIAVPGVATVSHRRAAPHARGERPARRRQRAVATQPAGAPGLPIVGAPAGERVDDTGHPGARTERPVLVSRTPPPRDERDGGDERDEHVDEHAPTQHASDDAWTKKTTAPPTGSRPAAPRERADEDGGDSPPDAQGPAPAATSAGAISVPAPAAPAPAGPVDAGEEDEPEPGSTGGSERPAGPPPDDAGMGAPQP